MVNPGDPKNLTDMTQSLKLREMIHSYWLTQMIYIAAKHIEAAGLAGRCQAVAGDFFQSVPSGGDAYILSRIIHDWDHDRSIAILKNCHSAMSKNAKLLVLEQLIRRGNELNHAKLADVNMLVITGGRERTEAEYQKLFASAGFKLNKIITTPSPVGTVIEGVRA